MAHGFFSALALAEEDPATSGGAANGRGVISGSGSRRGGKPKRLAGRRWISRGEMAGVDGSNWVVSRVVSYNVLAKCYAKQKHFTSCKAEHLRWSERRIALMEVLDELDGDILCLQEVEDYDKFWYKELSARGYSGVYKKRNSDRKYDGCATFYRTDKFDRLDTRGLEFDEILTASATSPDFATHNVALITVLRPRGRIDGAFCIANAHLFWDPSYEELKISQARALVRATEEMAMQHGGAPIILAGDFNSVPESCVYSLMTSAAAFNSAYATVHKSIPSGPASPSATPTTPPLSSATGDPSHLSHLHVGSPAAAAKLPRGSIAGGIPRLSGGMIFTKSLNPQSPVFSPGVGASSKQPLHLATSLSPTIATSHHGGRHLATSQSPTILATLQSPTIATSLSPTIGPVAPPPGSPGGGALSLSPAIGARKGPGLGEPAFTNYRDIFNGTIDYIFLRCVGGRRVEVQACLAMIGEAEARREGGGLPSSRHPSDHLPIAADLAMLVSAI